MGNVGGKIGGKYTDAINRINWPARYKKALQQILTNIVFILLCGIATILILLSNIFRSTSFSIPVTTRVKNALHLNRIGSRLPVGPALTKIKETTKELFA
jgi:hypothetical protein